MLRFDDLSLKLKMFLAPLFLLAALMGLAAYTLVLLNSNERQLSISATGHSSARRKWRRSIASSARCTRIFIS
jgi:hypothetical protein